MIRGDQLILLLILLYVPGFIVYFIIQQFKLETSLNPKSSSGQIIQFPADTSESPIQGPPENNDLNRAMALYDIQRENPIFTISDRPICQMDSCFRYKNCPIFTNPMFKLITLDNPSKDDFLYRALASHAAFHNSKATQCLTIVPVQNCGNKITHLINALPGLRPEAKKSNFVIWLNCKNNSNWDLASHVLKSTPDFDNTIIVSPFATKSRFEDGYDIVSPSIRTLKTFSVAALKRRIMINFDETCSYHNTSIIQIKKELKQHYGDTAYIFPCGSKMLDNPIKRCGKIDKGTLENSEFTVISLQIATNILSTEELQEKFFKILQFGSIPVIIGSRFVPPFHELIDWSQIIIRIPAARLLHLPNIIYNYSDGIREAMRIQGRLVFNKHLSSLDRVVTSVISTFGLRLSLPAVRYKPGKAEVRQNLSDFKIPVPKSLNFTVSLLSKSRPKWYVPVTRWQPTSNLWDQTFNNLITEFRPNVSLPNALHREMFTVVLLTFNRKKELMKIVNHLKTLPRVHKIIIVWNSPIPTNLTWPENITVPIHGIQMEKNSLNNRFFPFNAIETDAVLSIDDDIYVSHENLLFGFRVWQENRDRIVGFPARGVWSTKDGRQWFYDTNQCSTSMILTGCTFLHKMYHVMYTFQMPESIRKVVDRKMNCEDIAMNFLVSHLTQKPPIKVTSQTYFDCYGCLAPNNSLSRSTSHFGERTFCVAEFRKIYGYTALFNTQYFTSDMFSKRKGCLATRM